MLSPSITLYRPLPSNAAAASSKCRYGVLNPSSAIFHPADLQIHLAASAAFFAHNLWACFNLREETVTLSDWHAWRGVLDFPACTCPLCVLLCRHLLSRLLKLIAAVLPLSPPCHSLHAAALSPQTHTQTHTRATHINRSAESDHGEDRRCETCTHTNRDLVMGGCSRRCCRVWLRLTVSPAAPLVSSHPPNLTFYRYCTNTHSLSCPGTNLWCLLAGA